MMVWVVKGVAHPLHTLVSLCLFSGRLSETVGYHLKFMALA